MSHFVRFVARRVLRVIPGPFRTSYQLAILFLVLCSSQPAESQEPSPRLPKSTVSGGAYDKPFMTRLGGRTAIGGYMDLAGRYTREEGISEGWTFEARRFNLFTYSVIADGITVTSELEFEHGGEEVKVEYGLLDLELHDALIFRAGILLAPLGRTNLAHDSPLLELSERPLVATEIIPSTYSETGAGIWGSLYPGESMRLSYELYAVNGLAEGILESTGRTTIPAGKNATFEEDNNGEPAWTGRFSVSPFWGTDAGVSFYHGAYNRFEADGLSVDARRTTRILALDGQTDALAGTVSFEAATAAVEIPSSLEGIMASKQLGYAVQWDIPLLRGVSPRWPQSRVTASVRWDGLDLDSDVAGDDHDRLTLGINLRPIEDAVVKLNYEYNWMRDRDQNLSKAARVLMSVAAYF